MIKLIDILLEEEKYHILKQLRSPEERKKNYIIATQQKIQQYIKGGSNGDLELIDTPIISLPDNLTVGGSLSLHDTPITSLPNNLTVSGNLYLQRTPITSLPDDLKVKGNLYLMNTPITSLPDNLTVEGYLDLSDTPLSKTHTKKQIRQMVPGVKGNIAI